MQDVTAAILEHNDRILIARRLDGGHAGFWEFPGGKVEPGESAAACLERELAEEFGIETVCGTFFAESIYEYPKGRIRLLAYRVHWQLGALTPVAHDRVAWVKRPDLLRYRLLPADVPLARALQANQPEARLGNEEK